MRVKLFELRDRATTIPIMVIQGRPDEQDSAKTWLLRRAGWGRDQTFTYLTELRTGKCQWDPYEWGSHDRTFSTAHRYLEEHFNEHASGSVIDVEFILGETLEPKASERFSGEVVTIKTG